MPLTHESATGRPWSESPGLPSGKQVHMVSTPGTRAPDAQTDRQTDL